MSTEHGTESRGAAAAKGCLAIFVMVVVVALGIVACSAMVNGSKPSPRPAPTFTIPTGSATTDPPTFDPLGGLTGGQSATAYTTTLRASSFDYGDASDSSLVNTGRNACGYFDSGETAEQVVAYVAKDQTTDMFSAAYLTGAAVGAFCPAHLSEVTAYGSGS